MTIRRVPHVRPTWEDRVDEAMYVVIGVVVVALYLGWA